MLRSIHALYFPRLVHLEDTSFKSWSDSQKTTGIYKLDWNQIDELKKKRFLEHYSRCNPPQIVFPGTLPSEYDQWVKNLLFAIPTHYMAEIRRCAKTALMEWGVERHFDTMIREICLEPAISYIFVAFRMLADCLYDSETNYFYRGDDKIIAPQALLYKFWSFQTGRGLVKGHAQFHRLEYCASENQKVTSFLTAINEYEKTLEKSLPQMADVEGPSKKDPEKFDIDCVTEKDLNFKGMPNQTGLEILKFQWFNSRKSGMLNVNCGTMRRLGKTTFIKEVIKKYREKVNDKYKIAVLLPGKEYTEPYKDLLSQNILNFTSYSIWHRPESDMPILYFSDEVEGAEDLFYSTTPDYDYGDVYVGGMYSLPARYGKPEVKSYTSKPDKK